MARLLLLILAVAACGLVGCASHEPALVINPPAAAPQPSDFPGAASILQGFDLAPTRADWNIGDQVLVGIRAVKPSGTTTRYLLVELTAETAAKPMSFVSREGKRGPYTLESPVALTNLTLFDESGAKIDSAKGRFATKFLGCGVFDGAAVYADHPELQGDLKDLPPMTDAEFDQSMRGWLTLMAFSGSMNKRGMFKSMLEGVIARPNIFALLFNPSIGLTFDQGQWPTRSEAWSPDAYPAGPRRESASLSTIRLPLLLQIAGKPALRGNIFCAEPVAPLSLCGGLLHAQGLNADDPGIRIEIQLLACRRGAGGQAFSERAPKPESPAP